jgi:hypothetical protein
MNARDKDLQLEDLDPGVPERPSLEEQDWEDIETGLVTPSSLPENGDLRYDSDEESEALEDDDDNAYQRSDEALPTDEDEDALSRRPSREGSRFDEV